MQELSPKASVLNAHMTISYNCQRPESAVFLETPVGGLGLIRLAVKPAAAGRMGGGNGHAHFICRPSFITQCLCATGGSWKTRLVFQSWDKTAFQDFSGAGIRGRKEGFV